MLETNYRYLPLPYRISIERLDSSGERGRIAIPELRQWCDAYAVTYGLPLDETHRDYVASACAIARKRFPIDDRAA